MKKIEIKGKKFLIIPETNIVDHLCVEHNEKTAAIEDDLMRTYGRMEL